MVGVCVLAWASKAQSAHLIGPYMVGSTDKFVTETGVRSGVAHSTEEVVSENGERWVKIALA